MRKEINYMRMAVMNTAGAEQEMCINVLNLLERKYKAKRKLNKIRLPTLKAITCIAGFLFGIGLMTCGDAYTNIPVILMLASGSWLALISYANR